MPMSFSDAWNFYFTMTADLTWYLTIAIYTLFLVIIDWPHSYTRKSVLILLGKYALFFGFYLILGACTFCLENFLKNYFPTKGMVFSVTLIVVVPLVYSFLFLRESGLHRFLKISMMIASMMVSFEISRNLGLVVGLATNDSFFAVVFARAMPNILTLPLALMFRKFNISRYHNLTLPVILTACVVSYGLFFAAIFENVLRIDQDSYDFYYIIMFIYVVMIACLDLTYYSLYYIVQSRHKLLEAEIEKTLAKAESQAIEIDARNRDELTKLRHDMKNQLGYMNQLLQEGKTKEAQEYLNQLYDANQESLNSFSCPNAVISSVVNFELSKAKLKNIKIKAKAAVTPRVPIEDTDMVSLVTNILDNAIEAVEVRNNPEDEISFTVATYQDYVRVSCRNPIDESRTANAQTLRTTKKEKSHGYGTRIIKNIAKKYDGHASFDVENGFFVSDVVLTMNLKGEAKYA